MKSDNFVNFTFSDSRRGEPMYESGWKDLSAIGFYILISIIMHAILQEYVLDVSILLLN